MEMNNTADWLSLPVEIRLQILETLERTSRLAPYASVSKEWRALIERRNFRQLKLDEWCLKSFGSMVVRQRALVERITLDMDLGPCSCPNCRGIQEDYVITRKGNMLYNCTKQLFDSLRAWDPPAAGGRGLTLELVIRATTDPKSWSKSGINNARKGLWLARMFQGAPFDGLENLPRVRTITGFVLRRQVCRQVFPWDLREILNKLPRLENITYEPWRGTERTPLPQHSLDRALAPAISHFPKGLKQLSLFESFNEDFLRIRYRSGRRLFVPPDPKPLIGSALAHRSLTLHHLSAAYLTDALQFYQSCQPSWTWLNLQSLALASRLLTRTSSHSDICNLLRGAGVVALRMPELRTLALWNGGKGEACAFTYRRGLRPTVTWRGTWNLELEPRTIEAWEKVASEFTPFKLMVQKQLLRGDDIVAHGEAIYRLELPCRVVDPASLEEMRSEARD